MFNKIIEGEAEFFAPKDKKISKDLPVFYNPMMEYNRTVSVALLNALGLKEMQIALPLAGTGIRGIRFLKELRKGTIKQVYFNDYDKKAISLIKKNLKLNSIKSKFSLHNKDANLFLLESKGFDYIDIDPFGSPNKFLDSAIKRISRKGILGITATDTGALCGSYSKSCIRKYWSSPLRNEEMHEIGLRILIRKVQLIGMQFEKALIPILCFDKDHYMRVFFQCEKSKEACDKITKKHQFYKDAGPIWTGQLYDKKIIKKVDINDRFTKLMKDEFDTLGFYDIPTICRREKIKVEKKINDIITTIKKLGFKATRTVFSGQGIKSTISYDKFLETLRK